MVGIVAARLGAQVTATDLPELLPQAQSNADLNAEGIATAGGSFQARALWMGAFIIGVIRCTTGVRWVRKPRGVQLRGS